MKHNQSDFFNTQHLGTLQLDSKDRNEDFSSKSWIARDYKFIVHAFFPCCARDEHFEAAGIEPDWLVSV